MAYRGKYYPSFPRKYKGDPTNIIYRSLWERKFMVYCDKNTKILEWGSEEIALPYISPHDSRVHRYFPDFYIKVQENTGKIKRYLIEVKPSKDLSPPASVQGKKRSTVLYEMKTYQMNRDKFASARKWCDERNIIFDIWTEKHLRQKG